VPRITEESRNERRAQILDAARACVLEHGLEAVSIEMIVAGSGLSTGAVYRYFKGKDQILGAAFTGASLDIGEAMASVFDGFESGSPPELLEALLGRFTEYAHSGVGAAKGVDRSPVAIHGWSHAQTDPELRATLQFVLEVFRQRSMPLVERWREDGTVAPDADPETVTQLLLSVCLGYVVQHAAGSTVDVRSLAEGLLALARTDRSTRRTYPSYQR
jgi:AcrR family transcriptional regulator